MTDTKAREFDEPSDIPGWYELGADLRIAIRKQFSALKKELEVAVETQGNLFHEIEKLEKQLAELRAEVARLTNGQEMLCLGGEALAEERDKARDMLEKVCEALELSLEHLSGFANDEGDVQFDIDCRSSQSILTQARAFLKENEK